MTNITALLTAGAKLLALVGAIALVVSNMPERHDARADDATTPAVVVAR